MCTNVQEEKKKLVTTLDGATSEESKWFFFLLPEAIDLALEYRTMNKKITAFQPKVSIVCVFVCGFCCCIFLFTHKIRFSTEIYYVAF